MKIGAIVWGVVNVERAAAFWTQALHYRLKYPLQDDWAVLIPEEGEEGIQLSLNRITSPKARRHHMDLFTYDRDTEVQRLMGLGAVLKPWNYEEDADYTVMMNPDGNPFCVVQRPAGD